MSVTINPGYISSNVTLSDKDLEATAGVGGVGGIATAGSSSGKYYFEVLFPTLTGENTGVGWALQSVNLSTFPPHQFIYATAFGPIYNGDTSAGFSFQGWSQGVTGAIAVDIGNALMWVAADATLPFWNMDTSGAQDPVLGEGGIGFDNLVQDHTVYPFFYLSETNDSVVFTFLSSGFVGTPPSGFAAVDPGC